MAPKVVADWVVRCSLAGISAEVLALDVQLQPVMRRCWASVAMLAQDRLTTAIPSAASAWLCQPPLRRGDTAILGVGDWSTLGASGASAGSPQAASRAPF